MGKEELGMSAAQGVPLTAAIISAAAWCSVSVAAPQGSESRAATDALKSLSVEELMNVEVTSVSRRPERLLEAPAAIQVLSNEDLRRSGASNLPSALRLANNLDVAQENAHEWVISARGFSSDVGNKLLVLMDGRTLYTPLFSGVFWDRQDYVLEDLDRIEIISGPGGALWGANAVNGVINIISKSSADTKGLFVEAGGGDELHALASVRYGGALTEHATYRVYGKYSDRDNQTFANDVPSHDAWHTAQGGFRIDSQPPGRDSFTLQGDFYRNEEQITTGGDASVNGANLLGRWSRQFSESSNMSLQLYYDRTHLELPVPPVVFAPAGTFEDDLDTYDLDFQHSIQLDNRHHLTWGLGFRFTQDEVVNAPGIAFFPTELDQVLYSAFVQDEIALREQLVLTLGSKVEHTDYTGVEVEPSVRMQWNLSDRASLWGAVSRAVRTPSRIDREISQPSPGFLIVILQGGANFDSESVVAYELGYRAQLGARLTAAVSTFFNDYDDLRSTSLSPPDPVFNLPFPFFFENNLEGETYGFELSTTFQALDRWRLHGAYRVLQADIDVKAGRTDFNNALNETNDPEQQLSLRSSLDLPGSVQLDAGLRWVDTRKVNDSGVPRQVPDFLELDVRLAWNPTRALELSLVGRNLLDGQHPEFGVPGPTRVEIERSIYGKLVWRY
jgi:iron complex outermembrane receptor protein